MNKRAPLDLTKAKNGKVIEIPLTHLRRLVLYEMKYNEPKIKWNGTPIGPNIEWVGTPIGPHFRPEKS